MNIVALSNRLASKVPHWHELEKLSKEDKIEVIALLSMSMANADERNGRTLLWFLGWRTVGRRYYSKYQRK